MFRTRTPLSRFRRISTARLACVRPPASVHPEPGSNSPLYVCFLKLKLNLKLTLWFFLTWLLFYFQWSLILFASSKVSSVSCFRFASAKIKTIFEFAKLFLKFFFSHLNHLYSASTVVLLTIFAVAKVWIIFNMTKSFFKKKFHPNPLNQLLLFPATTLIVWDCKSRNLYLIHQTIYYLF